MSYLTVSKLSKKISKKNVLENINLNLDKGRIYGFSGKNGSGKSMLFKTISGLIKPTSGEIKINGKLIGQDISFPDSIGVIIEYPSFLPNLTGFKNLKYLADIKKVITIEDIRETISLLGLDPNDKRKYKKYSLGMKQRLGIAQAIMERPDLIILDEPTNALDSDGVSLVKNILLKMKLENKLILIASHDKEDLEYLCDEIFYLEEGKILKHRLLKENII